MVVEMDTDNNDKDGLEKDRQTVSEEFCSNATLHGLRHVYFSTGFRRIIWFMLFAAAIGLSVLLFRGQIQDFVEYKSYITIQDFDYETKDLFLPTLTICNKVPLINHGYERVTKIINITVQQFEDFYLKYLSRYRFGGTDITPFERDVLDALARHNITTVLDMLKLFEINQEDMFHDPLSKVFLFTERGDPDYPTCRIDYSKKCAIKETLSWRESLCHQINSFQPNKTSLHAWNHERKRYGRIMSVQNLHATNNMKRTRQVRKQAPYMDLIEGVVLYVHPYGMPHYIPEFYKRIFLPAGVWHFIKIDYTEVRLLPPPYRTKCGKKEYKYINTTLHPYSKAMCIIDCFLVAKLKECGCVGWEFKEFVDLPICNITQMKCYTRLRGKQINICKRNRECPNECVKSRYTISVEQMNIRSDLLIDKLPKTAHWQKNRSEALRYIKHNLVGLQLEYTNNAKEEIFLPAVTWSSLLGAIGGSIGLAMGFSVLTACEFIFFLIDYLKTSHKRKNKGNSVSHAV